VAIPKVRSGRDPNNVANFKFRTLAARGARTPPGAGMSVDDKTVRRIAHLARIAVSDAEVPHLQGELNAILQFVEELNTVNVEGVEPMTSVTKMAMKKRQDVVSDGGFAAKVVANAPLSEDNYYMVPKVVE